jgi:RNA polymerase sigma-70 factor (ECF subfamily)
MPASSDSLLDTEQYRARVVRYIRYLLHDASEAEDLAQETFIRAHCQQATLRNASALESWLFRIATHICIDRLRQRTRTSARQSDSPIDDLPIEDKANPSPFTVIQQKEMGDCVDQYVATLPDSYKVVLLLHDADGLTDNEIADLLNLPLTTVKMRLHRARERLRGTLESACKFGRNDRGVFVCEPKPGDKARSIH